MAINQHVYLMEEDENGKHTVYPVTDVALCQPLCKD